VVTADHPGASRLRLLRLPLDHVRPRPHALLLPPPKQSGNVRDRLPDRPTRRTALVHRQRTQQHAPLAEGTSCNVSCILDSNSRWKKRIIFLTASRSESGSIDPLWRNFFAICRPSVVSGVVGVGIVVVVVIGVCNRSQMRTSKCTCFIFGVSIGLVLARYAHKEFLIGQSSRSHATYRRPSHVGF